MVAWSEGQGVHNSSRKFERIMENAFFQQALIRHFEWRVLWQLKVSMKLSKHRRWKANRKDEVVLPLPLSQSLEESSRLMSPFPLYYELANQKIYEHSEASKSW